MTARCSPAAERHYLGYDPGGRGANGVAHLRVTDAGLHSRTSLVGCVNEALDWFADQVAPGSPHAIGVDTYLFWESGPQGWRGADSWLRAKYPPVSNSVFSSNSAFGSMAVQGMALAIKAKAIWPQAELIEAHPKVLYYALGQAKYDWPGEMTAWLCSRADISFQGELATEHEWDALISAWAAYQGAEGLWRRDLRKLSVEAVEPAGKVAYWWPE